MEIWFTSVFSRVELHGSLSSKMSQAMALWSQVREEFGKLVAETSRLEHKMFKSSIFNKEQYERQYEEMHSWTLEHDRCARDAKAKHAVAKQGYEKWLEAQNEQYEKDQQAEQQQPTLPEVEPTPPSQASTLVAGGFDDDGPLADSQVEP